MRFIQRAQPYEPAAARMQSKGYAPLLARLLTMRGVLDEERAESFLSPDLSQLYDPFLMHDMATAVERIKVAVQAGERIVVFGDYDVDGVTATAVMLSCLRDMGADVGYYLPNRHGEGYGLNEPAMRSLAGAYKLMITVDCGITAVKEVETAKECGMDVIVTDHHEPMSELPDCPCVNPKLGYPFAGLCGAGVAGKVVQALGGIGALEPLLDLVALGTIADIVPLVDENRILSAMGLRGMNRKIRPGISALAEVSGLLGKELTSGHVSFMLAPRINAGGRMGHSGRSVDMLLEGNRCEALKIARELDESNRMRQEQERGIFEEALSMAKEVDLREARCLVIAGEGWNPGVIGIVASRLVERFSRPVFLLAKDGDTCVGSGRSVPGVKLFLALDSMGELFMRYGGHDMAAGITIKAENIPDFAARLQREFEKYTPELFLPTMLYDLETGLDDLTGELITQMARLSPTGQGNPTPVFLLRGVRVDCARVMGAGGAHLKMRVSDGDRSMNGVAFKMGEKAQAAYGRMDMLVTPEMDDYNGGGAVRLLVRAFEPSAMEYGDEILRRGDELLRDFLSGIDAGAEEGGPRRYIRLKDSGHLRMVIKELIGQTPGGVLVLCSMPETAMEIDRWLEQERLSPLVCRSAGELDNRDGAPHILHCPAVNEGSVLSAYRHILLADGVPNGGWMRQLCENAPSAVVYAPPPPQSARDGLGSVMPDVEKVRAVYKAMLTAQARLRAVRSFSEVYSAITETEPAKKATVQIAMGMLRDMNLINYGEKPFSFALVRDIQGKRDAECTPTWRFYKEYIAGG